MTIIFVCGSCLFLLLMMCFSHRKRIGEKFRLSVRIADIIKPQKKKEKERSFLLGKLHRGTNYEMENAVCFD